MATLEILQKEEGFREMPYFDTLGILTIGYGRNLIANPLTLAESKEWAFAPTTRRRMIAIEWLDNKIKEVTKEVYSALPWTMTLDSNRRSFLILMAYQLGINSLLKFHLTLDLIKSHKYTEAAIELLKSKWARQTPERVYRMANLLQTGDLENYFS